MITDFQLNILAGYVISYLNLKKKVLTSASNIEYEIVTDKMKTYLSDMLSIIANKNIDASEMFDSIDTLDNNEIILKQVKSIVEKSIK